MLARFHGAHDTAHFLGAVRAIASLCSILLRVELSLHALLSHLAHMLFVVAANDVVAMLPIMLDGTIFLEHCFRETLQLFEVETVCFGLGRVVEDSSPY